MYIDSDLYTYVVVVDVAVDVVLELVVVVVIVVGLLEVADVELEVALLVEEAVAVEGGRVPEAIP